MDVTNEEESTLLIPRSGIPTAIRDTRRSYEKQLAMYLILLSTFFERMAFYSLAANLALTLQSHQLPLKWSSSNSLIAAFIFSGTSYMSTLIFAVISDAKLGRARTIIIGFVLYLTGYTLVTIIARGDTPLCMVDTTNHHGGSTIEKERCAPAILGTLICTAIGAGAVKSNMAVFGAEQIQESTITSHYFDKYVLTVNIGSIIATLVIPYIQNNPAHYFTGYLVADSMLLISTLFFIIGCRYYIHVKPYDTVITKCIPVVINAFQTWRKYKKDSSIDMKHANSSPSNVMNASYGFNGEEIIINDDRPSTFLDFAKAANHGKFLDRIVDDVKSLRSAIVVFILLVPYWLIYNQFQTTFPQQGQTMKLPYKDMPIIWMSLGDSVTIIIGIFIFNIFVYKYLDVRNQAGFITIKFIIGMIFALITMCIAGTVETIRQDNCHNILLPSNSSDLTIFTQLPQYIGMGLAELFAAIASYEFAYFAAPRSAQSLFMSLRFCSVGLSSFIGTLYSNMYLKPTNEPYFSCPPVKQTYWRFYTYFYILAGLQLIFIIIFIICHKKFRIIKLNPQQMERSQFLSHSSTSSITKQ